MIKIGNEVLRKQKNFWNHCLFHPTDAVEDSWGTLAAETGIPCITLDPAANGPDNIASPLEWYENIMRGNIRTLEQALGTR